MEQKIVKKLRELGIDVNDYKVDVRNDRLPFEYKETCDLYYLTKVMTEEDIEKKYEEIQKEIAAFYIIKPLTHMVIYNKVEHKLIILQEMRSKTVLKNI